MKLNLKIFILLFYCASLQAINRKTETDFESTKILGTIEQVVQKNNEKGAIEVKGEFYKPITSSNVKLTIKYKNDNNIWIDGWCKEFKSDEIYNKNLNAKLELPAKSSSTAYELKVEVSASQLNDLNEIYWNKSIKHYKEGAYTVEFITKPKVEIDPNKYSILLTPNTLNTLKYDSNGKLLALEDRAKTVPYHNKYYNELLLSNSNSELKNDGLNNYISVKRNADDNSDNYLVSTKDYIYQGSEYDQYVYPYHDPVFVYAGKFPSDGFQIFYARYGDFDSGSSLYDFTNPNNLTGRIFNLINSYDQKLSDIFEPGEPIVLVASTLTGTRIYKKDGTFFHLTGHTNFNPTSIYSGFPDIYYPNGAHEERGPGNERFYFKMKKNAEFSFYGMGAIGNYAKWTGHRPLGEVEKDIQEFIDYTGIFEEKSPCESNIQITVHEEGTEIDNRDWEKAPNSYIFDPNSNHSGLLIPVKKAYKMWEEGIHMGDSFVPSGNATAEVYWEDVHGLIKSNANYALEIVGSGDSAKIKVPVNKVRKGNAVIAYKVDGKIYWSWHVWVTDDPSNGSTYMSYDDTKRELKNGTTEKIPASEWGWMDRNLGAISSGITEEGWTRNNGLLYQWGRKDPIPPLAYKGDDFYEISGTVGRVAHHNAKNNTKTKTINDFHNYVPWSKANVRDNIRLSVKNPLSLIYVNNDWDNNQAYYRGDIGLPVNWFGNTPFTKDEISKVNLWSDNSQGIMSGRYGTNDHNSDSNAKSYKNKSSYDHCPNGWRIPSMLAPDFGYHVFNPWTESVIHIRNLRFDFSPFGPKTNIDNSTLIKDAGYYYLVPPKDNPNTPSYLQGIKLYPGLGFDMTSVGGHNMGIFPGTGILSRLIKGHGGNYTDQHEVYLWTATMMNWPDGEAIEAGRLHLVPDAGQPDVQDVANPTITGKFRYEPMMSSYTSDAMGCRCIKDPLYILNEYDFPTEYFTDNLEYVSFKDGLEHPNSYQIVKSAVEVTVQIPVNKAFSVQSEYLNNKEILNPSNYNNLKANVLWTTNTNLIKKIAVSNNAPGSLSGINNTTINVDIHPNQSGNAVVTLHNGSIKNPVYWSWHIWVTDNEIKSFRYATNNRNTNAPNFINYVSGEEKILDTEFMDRNLGALDYFPTVSNPTTPSLEELSKIKVSGGLQYQWGRKDPIPSFINPDGSGYDIYIGSTDNNGIITYTKVEAVTYNDTQGKYIVPYNTYALNIPSTAKIAEKVSKNLSYSVQNPLVYMVPSEFPYYNTDNENYTNAADWLIDDVNISADRWGRADKKSPFDPCPEGWRIPDLTIVNPENTNTKGITPFAKKGIFQNNVMTSISEVYKGKMITNNGKILGYNFNDVDYSIGNYPFVGIRAYRNLFGNTPETYDFNYSVSGIWLSGLSSHSLGRPFNLLFNDGGNIFTADNTTHPYVGMNCRCVKVKTTASGLQEGAFPRMPIPFYTASIQPKEFSRKEIKSISLEEKKLKVYPNPVVDALSINGDFTEVYYYQIYDLTGRLVSKGKFINNQVNLSELRAGIYLIRINDSKELTKIIKK
jgi:hypothetical protein